MTRPGSASKGQAVFRTPKLKTTESSSTTVITPFELTRKQHRLQALVRNRRLTSRQACLVPSATSHTGKAETLGQSEENSSQECASRVSVHGRTYKQLSPHQGRTTQKHEQERQERKAKVLEARRNLALTQAQRSRDASTPDSLPSVDRLLPELQSQFGESVLRVLWL